MIVSIVLWILEGLLCLAAYAMHYFTLRKMGMARYVILRSNQWEAAYNLSGIIVTFGIILSILLVVSWIIYLSKSKYKTGILLTHMALTTCLSLITLYVSFKFQYETLRAYYFIIVPLGLASIMEAGLALGILVKRLNSRKEIKEIKHV